MKSISEFCKENGISIVQIKELCGRNGIDIGDIVVFDIFDFTNDIYDRKGIDDLNRYIRSNQNIYLPKYILLFHSTGFNLKSIIEEEGLLPTSKNRRRSYQSTNGFVYLSPNRSISEMFGSLGNGSKIVTFLVLLRTVDLSIDMDQLKNKKIANPNILIKQTLADSIVYGGSLRYKGRIEPYKFISL